MLNIRVVCASVIWGLIGLGPETAKAWQEISEGFNDVSTLSAAGWSVQNNSSPLGAKSYFQGDITVFPAQSGAANAYIAANYQNTTTVGTISDWLLTPELTLKNGDVFTFYTRIPSGVVFPDRLEIRVSTEGASTDVGSTSTSVGDFTTLVLTVNPDLSTTAYPQIWTQYTVTIGGLSDTETGRVAFRYYVTDGGAGSNSNYIGIDTAVYTSPEMYWSGGPGDWGATGPNHWSLTPTGTADQPWDSSRAVFATGSGFARLIDNVSATGLDFQTGPYVIAPSTHEVLTLTGVATVTTAEGVTATIFVPIAGTEGLNKLGAGTAVLAGDNTYTGQTNILMGTLAVNGSLGSTAVTVESGGTLSGTGTIGGAVTVNDGGIIAAGNSPGVLSVDSLVLNDESILNYELGSPDSDRIDVTGALTLDGILNVSATVGFDAGTYRLMNYGGVLTDNGVSFGKSVQPFEYALSTGTDGEVNLIVTAAEWQYWDGAQTTPNGTVDGGTGLWNTSTTNWTSSTGNVNAAWDGSVGAVFKGTAGTVTITTAIAAPALSFQVDGYVIGGTGVGSLQLTGAGTVEVFGGATAAINVPITSGALTKTGLGVLALAGANVYTGGTTVKSGTLALSGGGSLLSTGAVTVEAGATFDISALTGSGTTVGDLAGAGKVALGAKELAFGTAANTSFTGEISGTGGSLKKLGAGTVTISQANTYTGTTTINAGTLKAMNATALGTSAVTLNTGATLEAGTSLTINSLTWNGGTVALTAGTTITVSNGVTLMADGEFSISGAAVNTRYTLMTYDTLTSNLGGFDFTVNPLGAIAGTITLVEVGDVTSVILEYGGGGGNLSNNTSPFTPTNANFEVNGAVQTSNAPNMVTGLIFDPNSSLRVFHTLTLTGGTLNVPTGTGTLYGSGTVVGPNGLTKTGEGLLNVDGTVQTTTFTVAAGTLGGSGLLIGDLLNEAIVSPGHSPGTLTVSGNFTQTAGGTLIIEVESGSVFDRLVVSGNAALAGTLDVRSWAGHEFQYGDQVPFLLAGSISGEFDTITMPNPSTLRGRFIADGGTGILVVAPTSYTLVAQNQNERNVAKALDTFIGASGDKDVVSAGLDQLTVEQYPAAFEAIMPGYYQTLTDMTIEQAVAQSQMIAQRLSAVRLGARGFQAIGMEAPLKNDKDGKSVMEAKDGKDILSPSADNKWGVWVLGNGIFSKYTSVNQMPNYRFQNGGFFVGADYAWSEHFATGVFGGYQGTYAKYGNGSMASLNSALFGGYATYQNGGFYSDAIVSGGYNGYIAKRSIEFSTINRTARSNPNGGQLTTYLDAGYDWNVAGFTFGPLISGQYTYSGIAPLTETGADSLDLRVEQQNMNSLRTNIGGRIAYTWNVTDKIVLVPEVRMFWQHEYLQNSTAIGASLDGGAGASFDYMTTEPGRDSVFAGAGVSAQFGKDFNAFLYYNTDFGRQDYISQMVSTGLGWKF